MVRHGTTGTTTICCSTFSSCRDGASTVGVASSYPRPRTKRAKTRPLPEELRRSLRRRAAFGDLASVDDFRTVHVRRATDKRCVPSALYTACILPCRDRHADRHRAEKRHRPRPLRANVTIFSEASGANETNLQALEEDRAGWREMQRRGYRLALDAPLTRTWHEMICSDALVMGRSSFSFVPALYHTTGTVVVQQYAHAVHASQPDWLSLSKWPPPVSKVIVAEAIAARRAGRLLSSAVEATLPSDSTPPRSLAVCVLINGAARTFSLTRTGLRVHVIDVLAAANHLVESVCCLDADPFPGASNAKRAALLAALRVVHLSVVGTVTPRQPGRSFHGFARSSECFRRALQRDLGASTQFAAAVSADFTARVQSGQHAHRGAYASRLRRLRGVCATCSSTCGRTSPSCALPLDTLRVHDSVTRVPTASASTRSLIGSRSRR